MKRRTFLRNTIVSTTGMIVVPSFLTGKNVFMGTTGLSDKSTTVNIQAPGTGFSHFWSKCVGAGRANEGLRASWLEHLKLVKQHCGFQYCRFHGIFHDDMFVYKEVAGKPIYNWQYVDDLFDRMLETGVKPFVELGFVPKAMASTPNTTFWWKGNSSPPLDYNKWSDLVSAFTRHCIDRYGLVEVKTWYFEVWNEPDLHGFWDGTKTQYFELYKYSVNAIKTIDKNLKVGGPSTSNFVPDSRFDGEIEDKSQQKTLIVKDINALEWRGVWINDFVHYCAKNSLPLDFISTHPYPTDWAIDPETKKGAGRVRKVNATKDDLEWLRRTIRNSAYPSAEIHCTEWSSSPSARDTTHDSLQAATYIIKANIDAIGLADSLSYWTFTDVFEEGGAGNSVFHGGFGLINYQGIVKPSFHGYRMLNQLGNELLYREEGMIITKNAQTQKMTALLYNYPDEYKDVVNGNVEEVLRTGTSRKFTLKLEGLKPFTQLTTESLNKNSGFAYPEWKNMGCPEPPTRGQTDHLKMVALSLKTQMISADKSGIVNWEPVLQPWECVLIQEK